MLPRMLKVALPTVIFCAETSNLTLLVSCSSRTGGYGLSGFVKFLRLACIELTFAILILLTKLPFFLCSSHQNYFGTYISKPAESMVSISRYLAKKLFPMFLRSLLSCLEIRSRTFCSWSWDNSRAGSSIFMEQFTLFLLGLRPYRFLSRTFV